jgi:hypothetical protein
MSGFLAPALALFSATPAAAVGNAVLPTNPGPGNSPVVINNYVQNIFPPNDDGSTALTPLGFHIDFFGQNFGSAYVNNNGNITFTAPLHTFTPSDLTTFGSPIVAPFFADVDTSTGGSPVNYGQGTLNGHLAFVVNWPGVTCFDTLAGGLNNFQLILVDRPDLGTGPLGDDFQIIYNYNQIQWDTGTASDGNAVCQNIPPTGTSAFVGYSDGTNTPGNSFNLPGSGVAGAFLDGGPHALISNMLNSNTSGSYVFFVHLGVPVAGNNGYRMVAADGGAFAFGLNFNGSLAGIHLNAPIIGMANSPGPDGYLMAGADGGVFAIGGAQFSGSLGGQMIPSPISAIAATPAGDGYWLAAKNGHVYNFGNTPALPAVMLPPGASIVGMASTNDGMGAWLTDQRGDIYAEGTAPYLGGANTVHPVAPITGIASSPSGGYAQVAADGGVFAYGVQFQGSVPGSLAPGQQLVAPIVGIAFSHSGAGYWEVGGDGGLFNYGDAPFLGSIYTAIDGQPLNAPIVGIEPLG